MMTSAIEIPSFRSWVTKVLLLALLGLAITSNAAVAGGAISNSKPVTSGDQTVTGRPTNSTASTQPVNGAPTLTVASASSTMMTSATKTPLRVRRKNKMRTSRATSSSNLLASKSTSQPPLETTNFPSVQSSIDNPAFGSRGSKQHDSSHSSESKPAMKFAKILPRMSDDSGDDVNINSAASLKPMATTVLPAEATVHRSPPREQHLRYGALDDTYRPFGSVGEKPKYFTYSQSRSYSASTGNEPQFSSSELYSIAPYEEVHGAGSEINTDVNRGEPSHQTTRRSDPGKNKGKIARKDCRVVQKPMPNHLRYGLTATGNGNDKDAVMMSCYVCGKKDEPYANGGYVEECNLSPTNEKLVYVAPSENGAYHDTSYDNYKLQERSNNPRASGTKTDAKLYAGEGQSPYLSAHSGRVATRGASGKSSAKPNVRQDYDPYYDPYAPYEDYRGYSGSAYPEATDSKGSYYDSGDGYRGGDDGGAETDKSACKIVYRGKMKCKICGDSKSDAAFEEQCDYEKDSAPQHHSHAYDYASGNEKRYSSRPHADESGSPSGGRAHGNGNDGGYGGDSYGDDYGRYNYPNYDHYGSGTDYGPSYDSDSNYGDGRLPDDGYERRSEGRGRHRPNNRSSQKVQPQASSPISDKKDIEASATNRDKKNCKVIYKDLTSYSPYTSKKDKPKMKCLVCTGAGGYGGVTEECSYNGAGQLSASFAGPSDVSPFFGRDARDSFNSPFGFDDFHDAFF